MANEDVKFARGLSSHLPVEKLPGRFLFETDTGTFYLDVNSDDRVPVTDPRLTERLDDEFQGTKLASADGVGPGTGAYFKIIDMTGGSIEDLPNFYTEGEDPQPTYAIMMTSKVRQGMSDSVYVQSLFCNTGSVYSRGVTFYSGNYYGDPWIKIGPNSGDTSDFATKEELADYLPLTGGTLTGSLTLNANPTSNLHAATKQYVDNAVSNVQPPATTMNQFLTMTAATTATKVINGTKPLENNLFFVTFGNGVTASSGTFTLSFTSGGSVTVTGGGTAAGGGGTFPTMPTIAIPAWTVGTFYMYSDTEAKFIAYTNYIDDGVVS